MKHILIFLAAFSATLGLFWYGGADLLDRNPMNAYLVAVAAFLASCFTFLPPKP